MVGNDYQRIIDGINHWKESEFIDSTYLLFDEKKDKYGFASQINAEELVNTLKSLRLRPRKLRYNPQSYENVFSTLYNILKKEVEERQRKVLIDTTSTTKEAYGATVTISLMFKNVRIYIVPPIERGWYVPSPKDPNFEEWFLRTRSIKGDLPQEIYLPGQRLEQPTDPEKIVLIRLFAKGGYSNTLGSIIKWCKCDPLDPVTKNRFSRLIRRLEKKGFVEKRRVGREKEVYLTLFGKILAQSVKEYEKKGRRSYRRRRRRKKRKISTKRREIEANK
jgi:DNA-binding MarR family transcriptional regulator